MDNKTIQEIEKKIVKVEKNLAVVEAKQEGLVLTIAENDGRFSIVRENYDKDNKANKNLKRLVR